MPGTELDWTFDTIPAESSAGLPAPRPAVLWARPRRTMRRGFAAAMLLLTAAAGLGLFGFTRAGWQRVRAQIEAEVVYEDRQSLAANVEAVRAVQAGGYEAWARRRASETAHGFPATLPADNLLPVDAPPSVLAVQVMEAGVVQATVARRFSDSAGQVFEFVYQQRYQNLDAGLWARLPPDESPAAQTAEWTGHRLLASFPESDAPWMAAALPRIDGYLAAACADWQCPPGLTVSVAFAARLSELPPAAPARRPARPPGAAGGYPVIFDLPFRIPGYPRRVQLPSPSLAGRPRDEAASDALIRATTSSLLSYLGSELARTNRGPNSDFLDALVARAEIRLGLSQPPEWPIGIEHYVPADELWRYSRTGAGRGRRPNVFTRLQALNFLDFALAGRAAEAEAHLLSSMRQLRSLEAVLSDSLNTDGQAIIQQWSALAAASLSSSAPVHWGGLEGLAYLCAGGGAIVRQGGPQPLAQLPARLSWLPGDALSPDGQYLVTASQPSINSRRFQVLDLTRPGSDPVAAAGWPLGWTSGGQLAYWQFNSSGPDGQGDTAGYWLRLLDPRTGASQTALNQPLALPWEYTPAWTANGAGLAVTLAAQPGQAQSTRPAVVWFGAAPGPAGQPQLLALPEAGYAAAISPDGRWLAYAAGSPGAQGPAAEAAIVLVRLESGKAISPPIAGPLVLDSQGFAIRALRWAPDSQTLALLGQGQDAAARLLGLTLNRARPGQAAEVRVLLDSARGLRIAGFSADSRYLAAYHLPDFQDNLPEAVVIGLDSGAERRVFARHDLSWAPHGHQLAVPGAGGLYVLNAATGEHQWLAHGGCAAAWRGVS